MRKRLAWFLMKLMCNLKVSIQCHTYPKLWQNFPVQITTFLPNEAKLGPNLGLNNGIPTV